MKGPGFEEKFYYTTQKMLRWVSWSKNWNTKMSCRCLKSCVINSVHRNITSWAVNIVEYYHFYKQNWFHTTQLDKVKPIINVLNDNLIWGTCTCMWSWSNFKQSYNTNNRQLHVYMYIHVAVMHVTSWYKIIIKSRLKFKRIYNIFSDSARPSC